MKFPRCHYPVNANYEGLPSSASVGTFEGLSWTEILDFLEHVDIPDLQIEKTN